MLPDSFTLSISILLAAFTATSARPFDCGKYADDSVFHAPCTQERFRWGRGELGATVRRDDTGHPFPSEVRAEAFDQPSGTGRLRSRGRRRDVDPVGQAVNHNQVMFSLEVEVVC